MFERDEAVFCDMQRRALMTTWLADTLANWRRHISSQNKANFSKSHFILAVFLLCFHFFSCRDSRQLNWPLLSEKPKQREKPRKNPKLSFLAYLLRFASLCLSSATWLQLASLAVMILDQHWYDLWQSPRCKGLFLSLNFGSNNNRKQMHFCCLMLHWESCSLPSFFLCFSGRHGSSSSQW